MVTTDTAITNVLVLDLEVQQQHCRTLGLFFQLEAQLSPVCIKCDARRYVAMDQYT